MSNFNSELGLQAGQGPAAITLDTRPEHQVAPGLIHFAVLATLAEVSAAQAVSANVVPANVNLSLLAPASPGRLEAQGRLLRRGKRLAVAEGEVRQNQKIVAKATVTFAVI
jgi:uncharacterized protein (TIGR00369 family)